MSQGQLHLFGMNGIFYKEMLHSTPYNFEDKETLSFDGAEDFDTPSDALETRFYFTPITVNGATEYVTGFFTDAMHRKKDYRVTIWLLVEECAMPTGENKKDTTHE